MILLLTGIFGFVIMFLCLSAILVENAKSDRGVVQRVETFPQYADVLRGYRKVRKPVRFGDEIKFFTVD